MAWWAGNMLATFVLFLVAIPVSAVILYKWRGQPHARWRSVDLFVVCVGGLGLMGLAFQAQGTKDQVMLPSLKAHLDWQRKTFETSDSIAMSACAEHHRTKNSPPNYDDIVAKQIAVCDWVKTKYLPMAQKIEAGAEVDFDVSIFDSFPKGADDYIFIRGPAGAELRKMATDWNEALRTKRDAESSLVKSAVYLLLTFLSPYILAIALAVQLTKIFYERRE